MQGHRTFARVVSLGSSLVFVLGSMLVSATASAEGTPSPSLPNPSLPNPSLPSPKAGTRTTPILPISVPAESKAALGVAPSIDESVFTRARDLMMRAKVLDETAAIDEKTAADLSSRIGALRNAAKIARDRADRADRVNDADRLTLVARAEDLEADVIISELEITMRQRAAIENRRMARDLRARAVKVVREPSSEPQATAANDCDPPFHFTSDGRKVYRIECLAR